MSRYIDADMIEYFKTFNPDKGEKTIADMAWRSDIDAIPTADVAPVVHGEWIDKGEDYMIRWTCSNCGRRDTHIYNFCPDCGADMRGGISDKANKGVEYMAKTQS